ncbi:hypothetical protein [Kitasatospora sp. NPDC056731]|uniref:hypothetical protein n=1 Tax=Kitasatospora sp. NPDC056731 TaxID=3155422 RepID=UPI003441FD0B
MAGSEEAGPGHEVWVAAAGEAAGAAATAAIRLVGLLPAGWACGQRIEGRRIVLRVAPPGNDGAGTAQTAQTVERWLAGALEDRALAHWRAVPPEA